MNLKLTEENRSKVIANSIVVVIGITVFLPFTVLTNYEPVLTS